jgi:mono/diheme cytochrome c family protein
MAKSHGAARPEERASKRTGATPAGSSRGRLLVATLVALGGMSVLAGCRGDRSDQPPRQFFPDMDDSPRWNAQAASEFFADGRTMRPPVEGAVAHARWGYNDARVVAEPMNADRQDLLQEDPAVYLGRRQDQYVQNIPIAVDAELILRGQERFNIFCAACHGYAGDGQGMVGVRWSTPVPSFHAPDLKNPDAAEGRGTDGYIYHIALNGVIRPDGTPSMPPYRHALNSREAWSIVAYIRVLQEAHDGGIEDVPEERRRQLMEERLRVPSAPRAVPGPGQTAPASPQSPTPGTPGMTPPSITNEGTTPPSEMPRQNP